MGVRADLDKLLALGSVQMNLHCTHLIAVLQFARTEYKHFQCAFSMYITSFIDSLNSYDEHIFPLLNS